MAETSRWNIRQVYLYLVCFATLMMLIVGSVQLIMSFVDILYPEPLYPLAIETKMRYTETQQKNQNISQEEIDRQLELESQQRELSMKRSNIRRVINSTALILVSLPFYLYHWRKIQHGEPQS